MKISKFDMTSEEADPYLGLPYDADKGVVISDKIIENSRWAIQHELIFNYKGKIYLTGYSVGATEQQDERPWEYEDPIDCIEVKAVEKTITVYERIKE